MERRNETSGEGKAGQAPRTQKSLASRLKRIFRVAAITVVLFYLIVVACGMLFEDSLIYFPLKYPNGLWQPEGLPIEDAWFQAADGPKLHGWYLPHEKPVAVILFCHGNGGNVTHRIEKLHNLHRLVGVSVLVFDYRGYGRSEGHPNERGVLADARAARSWLAERAGVAEREIVVLGESLGGGVAVDLAAQDGARALVLESTFTSIPDVAAYHYPWLPVRLCLSTRFDSLRKIGSYHGPLLQCHGDADTIIPYAIGRRLFDAANDPKDFVTVARGDHNDLPPRSYYATLRRFLQELPE